MKIDDNQRDLYLGGVHYIRKNANEPWDFASEQFIKKYDLDGNLTHYDVLNRVTIDIPPNKSKIQ